MKGKHPPGTALFFSNVTCTAAYDIELTKYYKKFARERQPDPSDGFYVGLSISMDASGSV
jgi:hypothetical protein